MSGGAVLFRRLAWPKLAREDLGAGSGLLLVALFFFRRAVLGQGILFRRDISLVWYPQVESFVRSVAVGSWPLWDPYRGFGQPLLADPSAEILYPFTWLNLVAQPWTVYTFFVVAHLSLSGIGLYAFARRLGVSRGGALTAATAWMASGPFLSLASTWHHMAGAAWIPWVFLAADAALERRDVPRILLWGGTIAGQILAGSADMVAMTLVAVAADTLVRRFDWAQPAGPLNRRLAVVTAAAFVAGLAFSAAQWLPTLEMAQGTSRLSLGGQDRTTWSLHPLETLEIVLPFHWNELPLSPSSTEKILDWREPWLHSVYLGLPFLALALAGATGVGMRRRGGFALVACCAVLVALGRHTPAYGILAAVVPPLRILRFPVKAMVVAAFAIAVLAGLGFERWAADAAQRDRHWRLGVSWPIGLLLALCVAGTLLSSVATSLWAPAFLVDDPRYPALPVGLAPLALRLLLTTIVGGVVLFLSQSRRISGRAQATALGLVMLVDLAIMHCNLHPVAPKAIETHRPEVLASLGSGLNRVYVNDYSLKSTSQQSRPADASPFRPGPIPPGWSPLQFVTFAALAYLTPPTGGRWGVYGSYDLDLLGLQPGPLVELNDLLRKVEGTAAHTRLLQMGSVSKVVDLAPPSHWPDLSLDAVVPSLFPEPIRVYDVPRPLPRAFVVGRAVSADGREALERVTSPDFDPRQEVVVTGVPRTTENRAVSGQAQIVDLRPDRVVVSAELSAPGYLVLVDGYAPGWRVSVDGSPAPLLRANIAFRAVPLGDGSHDVEFTYRPSAVYGGLVVSAAAIAVALGYCLLGRRPGQ